MKMTYGACLNSTETCGAFVSCVFCFFFFCQLQQETAVTVQWIVAALFLLFRLFITSMGLVYCSWDPQISLFSNFFIKNGSHDTIHIFKNYFATVFSVSVTISSIQTDSWSLSISRIGPFKLALNITLAYRYEYSGGMRFFFRVSINYN